MKARPWVLALLAALLAWWTLATWHLDAVRWSMVPHGLGLLASGWPPDLSANWPPDTSANGSFLWQVLAGLLETLNIAIVATILGAALAVPIGMLGARNLAPRPVVAAARGLSMAIRVLPDIFWALLAVLVLGIGPLAGFVAVTLYTVGFLSKLQYEALEGVPRDALEAATAMGASRFQRAWHVALPEAGNALRSQLLFMFEYNVRESSIVGYVGAGGLGWLVNINWYLSRYDRILTIILVLFVTVAAMDLASMALRRRFVELEGNQGRPTFADALLGRMPKGAG
ncbi:MAG: PhnE/PtxC family ABC transporter permease [Thermoplasmatota archaeon]